ncbi:Superfamily I DNA and RNA helicases [Streptomyces sp. ScaeMP-e48]|uniref:nuclease-related domain-containing DEAD/DEAH box helicase n=1 Tax=Streptomyces TaxID=1883 RepID=UPI0008239ABB|nr:NERD domain-containing protein/DEAD/DEAH box helicase [Streptomyces sp. ScaeMP-e48]SCK13994.1 Superfamily I DNA and RNA helicases [Streptomyces sp. ScaeMP-e48]
MTRMIPSAFDARTTSPGEREVFERLRDDPATDGWVALHSLGIATHPRQIQGEADFVVVVPGSGIVCLEVKSHRHVARLADGRWQLGQHHPEIRGPFVQSDEAKHAIVSQLRKASPGLPPIPVTSAVCFTHARFQVANPTEWHSWQAIDTVAFHRNSISALIRGVLKGHREHLAGTPSVSSWFSPSYAEPTRETCTRVVYVLRPAFEFTEPPKIRRHRRQEEVERFTRQQYQLLDMISDNPRCVVKGAAGTGKTFIALEATRRLAANGSRVLLCCYNTLLGQWLKEETAADELITAGTLHSFMGRLAPKASEQHRAGEGDLYTEVLPELALGALLDGLPPFDALVVDEAQDLMLDTYLDVLDASVRGGLGSGRWLAFGDFTNQAIFDSGYAGIGLLADRVGSSSASFTLAANCRNVPSISQYVEETSRLDPGYSGTLRSENGREALREWWSTPEEQDRHLVKHLARLHADGFAPDEIVVLSPRRHGSAAELCADQRWSRRLTPFATPRSGAISYGTVHAFKGLDAAAVIVTDVEEIKDEKSEALFYVASSRARDDLTIIAGHSARSDFRRLVLGE